MSFHVQRNFALISTSSTTHEYLTTRGRKSRRSIQGQALRSARHLLMFATMIVLYGYAIVERIPSYSASKVILCKDHTNRGMWLTHPEKPHHHDREIEIP